MAQPTSDARSISATNASNGFSAEDSQLGICTLVERTLQHFQPLDRINMTFVIGCWTPSNGGLLAAALQVVEVLSTATPALAVSGGDAFFSGDLTDGPVVAKVIQSLLSRSHVEHFAFAHTSDVSAAVFYPDCTLLLPHAALSQGDVFYSGMCPHTKQVLGSLQLLLAMVEQLQDQHHRRVHVDTYFVGGGTVSLNEFETLLALGDEQALPGQWTLTVLPLPSSSRAQDPGAPYGHACKLRQEQRSLGGWRLEEDASHAAILGGDFPHVYRFTSSAIVA